MRRHSQERSRSFSSIYRDLCQQDFDATVDHEPVISALTVANAPQSTSRKTTSPKPRRSTFSLALPWRPSSEYATNDDSSSGSHNKSNSASRLHTNRTSISSPQLDPTSSQRRFVTTFPELSDLVSSPAGICAPCLATPPHTPPESLALKYPSTSSISSSGTLHTISSDQSSSSTSSSNGASLCLGHFSDYSCMLERYVLWPGTLYITAAHICFHGKHLGKTVRVVIDFKDLVSIECEQRIGLFPTSIRIRVNTAASIDQARTSDTLANVDVAHAMFTKDYVLTGFENPEHAIVEVERSWMVHRQVARNLLDESFAATRYGQGRRQADTSDFHSLAAPENLGGQDTKQEEVREEEPCSMRRRRTYSLTTDDTLSISDIFSGPGRSYRSSFNGDNTKDVTNQEGSFSRTRRHPPSFGQDLSNIPESSGSFEVAPLRCRSYTRRERSSSQDHAISSCNASLASARTDLSARSTKDDERDYNVPHSHGLLAPIPIQRSASATSLRGRHMKPPTPPPSLLSPSLTTTKVSHSSSTVHGVARLGVSPGMVVHVRKESEGSAFEEPSTVPVETVRSEESGPSFPSVLESRLDKETFSTMSQDPLEPAPCGCERHYKNAALSTVVPMPLEQCFELLFSGKGAGYGDTLTRETHRSVNQSTHIRITPWTRGSTANKDAWEGQERQLDYSVSFKVPMLTKASMACFETQQVLHYSRHIARVHIESRIPSLPFGEQYSTVGQICLTWDSPGNTRIKCFTQVRFKKSIVLSSKIETSSLEGFSGYYREFIRRLVEEVEGQRNSVLVQTTVSASTSTSLPHGPPLDPSEAAGSILHPSADESQDTALTGPSQTSRRPNEVSAAQSLLSQQHLRNPPSLSRRARLSTDSMRPHMDALLPKSGSRLMAGPGSKDVASDAAHSNTQMDMPAAFSSESSSTTGMSKAGDMRLKRNTTAATLWADVTRKTMAIFNRFDSGYHPRSASIQVISSTSNDALPTMAEIAQTGSDIDPSSKPLEASDKAGSPAVGTVGFSGEGVDEAVSSPGNMSLVLQQQSSLAKPARLKLESRSLPRIVVFVFVLGLALSVVNIWQLFSAVSSMVVVMQSRQDQTGGLGAVEQHSPFVSSAFQRQLQKPASLIPLQMQTEILRAEIQELRALLQLTRQAPRDL